MKSAKPTLNLDASRCPICGQQNRCAITDGKDPSSCWCIAPEVHITEAMKAAIPKDKQLTACICANCITRLASDAARHEH